MFKVGEFVKSHAQKIGAMGGAVVGAAAGMVAAAAPAFATATVTSEQLAPITTDLTANVGVILPVGITIMGTLIGISLIPRLLYKFF